MTKAKTNNSLIKSQEEYCRNQAEYEKLIKLIKSKPPYIKNAVKSFLVGGVIALVAQIIMHLLLVCGIEAGEATLWTIVIMIFSGALLAGLGVYEKFIRVGGAGAVIPITGLASYIVLPALELKRRGFVHGIGTGLLLIAGPVFVYGFIVSVLIGMMSFAGI